MMDIQIKEVKTKKDFKKFVDFPYKLYSTYPDWVPPLKSEVYKLLDVKKNSFWNHSDRKMFIAEKDGIVAGRIMAIIDHNYIDYYKENIGYFGFFEAIDNQTVANKLYEATEKYLKDNDITKVIGPLNPSTNEECGFLLEGFDAPPLLMMTYTPPYYLKLTEEAGYSKAKDLYAFHAKVGAELPDKVKRLLEKLKQRNKVVIKHVDMKHFKEELEKVKLVYNSAWEKNWGFVPMTEEEIDEMAKNLKSLVVPEFVQFAEVNGKTVAFMWSMPDYNYVIKKMKGKLNPFIFLKEKKNIKWVRLITFGIIEGYRKMGIDALFFADAFETAKKMGFTDAEFSWVLEENVLVHRAAKVMGGELYKKYRIYGKQLRG